MPNEGTSVWMRPWTEEEEEEEQEEEERHHEQRVRRRRRRSRRKAAARTSMKTGRKKKKGTPMPVRFLVGPKICQRFFWMALSFPWKIFFFLFRAPSSVRGRSGTVRTT